MRRPPVSWIPRLVRWASQPIDETRWRRWRDRAALGALGLATLLALQTVLVHSPGYVVNAIYHERQALGLAMRAMKPEARAKLLERLCLAQAMFEGGGNDPYAIPDSARCRKTE